MQNYDMRRYEHWQITVKQKTHINNPKTRDWLVREFEQCINHYWHNSVESHYWMSAMFSRILCRLEDIGLASEDVAHPAGKTVFNTVIAISSYINEHLDEDIGKQVMEEHFRLNYDYIDDLPFDWISYSNATTGEMRPGGSAVATFSPIQVRNIEIILDVPKNQCAINISEIVVLGK